MKFTAVTRKAQGTGASRRLRRADKLPGIVYGGKVAATPIELDHNEIFHALRKEKFHASILEMVLDGKSERVLLRSFQMHPYKPQVLHIDFQRVAADEPIRMNVPLHFVGEETSPAVVAEKANINHAISELLVSCLPDQLPLLTSPVLQLKNRSTFPTLLFLKALQPSSNRTRIRLLLLLSSWLRKLTKLLLRKFRLTPFLLQQRSLRKHRLSNHLITQNALPRLSRGFFYS